MHWMYSLRYDVDLTTNCSTPFTKEGYYDLDTL